MNFINDMDAMKRIFICLMAVAAVFTSSARNRGTAIVAHRGYWNCEEGGFSHNSLAAFKAAFNHGFWGAEFDVNMTSDGELLVYHDSAINGKHICMNPKSTFDDVRLPNGECIPTVDDFLEYASDRKGTVLVYELKCHDTPELEDRAVALTVDKLKKYGLYDSERVIFISFSISQCRKLAEAAPGFTVQYLWHDLDFSTLAANGVNGIDMDWRTLIDGTGWIKGARENGFSINAWTVNAENDIREVLGAGVDQITTDEPLRTRRLMKSMKIKEV